MSTHHQESSTVAQDPTSDLRACEGRMATGRYGLLRRAGDLGKEQHLPSGASVRPETAG